jgi:hypothetical protein
VPDDSNPSGYVEHAFAVPAGSLPAPSPAWSIGDIESRSTILLNSDHGAWLNGLLATTGVQPVWASRWEGVAAALEPMLGLIAPLPVVEFSRHQDVPALHCARIDARRVKIDVLNKLYPTQAIVWIDHLVTQSRIGRAHGGHAGRWRYYQHVDGFTGLTLADIAQVDAFIAWVTKQRDLRSLL